MDRTNKIKMNSEDIQKMIGIGVGLVILLALLAVLCTTAQLVPYSQEFSLYHSIFG